MAGKTEKTLQRDLINLDVWNVCNREGQDRMAAHIVYATLLRTTILESIRLVCRLLIRETPQAKNDCPDVS